jgi:tetratricopeptide (TPR) repeat protein
LTAALADWNAAIQLTPQDASPLDPSGLIYLKTGQWDAAIADYTAALKIDQKSLLHFHCMDAIRGAQKRQCRSRQRRYRGRKSG